MNKITEIDVRNLIPQREPIIMIDALVEALEKSSKTKLLVTKDNFFVESDFLLEAGIIENIAQSTAAFSGYQSYIEQKPIARGFIGAVKNLKIVRCPKVDELLETNISVVAETMGALIVQGEVFSDKTLVASCRLNVFID